MKKFKKIDTETPDLQKVQDNVELFTSTVLDKAILDGVLLKDVNLTTGIVNKVGHKLGRKPLGYIIIKKNATADIWNGEISNRLLELYSSANITVNLWIF